LGSLKPTSRTTDTEGVLTLALSLGLSLGCLDVCLTLFSPPRALASFLPVLALAGVTALILFLAYTLLWFLLVGPAGRRLELEALPLATALAVWMGLSFALGLVGELLHFTLSTADLFKLVIVLGSSLLTAAVVYLGGWAANFKWERGGLLATLSLVGPLVLAETLVLLWLQAYVTGSFTSASSLLAVVVYLLVVVLSVANLFLLRGKIRAGQALAGALAVLLLALVVSAGLGWTKAPAAVAGGRQQSPALKHVILITVDTLRADALSLYSSQGADTPHIDALGGDAVVFRNASVPAPWTLPSIASLMTGVSPNAHQTKHIFSRLPDNLETLAERLGDAGYAAGAIVSNPVLDPAFNLSQGFQQYESYPKLLGYSFAARALYRTFPDSFDPTARGLAARAADWIERHREQPFFLWVHFFDPHEAYTPPPEYAPPPLSYTSTAVPLNLPARTYAVGHVPPVEERLHTKALYEGEVRYTDAAIGELLQTVKQQGLYDDTLIILTSDHGEEFWEHGSVSHGHTLYRELLQVPMIVKLPGPPAPLEVAAGVEVTALMPTILELCGVDYEREEFSVASLAPLWGPSPQEFVVRPVVSSGLYYRPWDDSESVLFGATKYIASTLTGREQLYDLQRDPGEKISLVASEPELLAQSRALLAAHDQEARQLRARYRIQPTTQALPQDLLQHLKTLGYLQ